MAQTTVRVRTVQDACVAVGWTGHRTLTIDRPEQAGGTGLGFNGGELLLLAIGGCYCNDIFREAAKRGIAIKSVQVDVEADWGGEPVRAQHVTLAPRIEAQASEAEILDLIAYADRIAEIPNSLRMGTPVTLRDVQAVTAPG
jgi:organic hydroperoxide reductase OsmC/OhrA